MQAEHDFPSVISFLLCALDVDVCTIPYIHNSKSKRSFFFAVLVLDFDEAFYASLFRRDAQ